MLRSLVGSEMCIRDRLKGVLSREDVLRAGEAHQLLTESVRGEMEELQNAAYGFDSGGRRSDSFYKGGERNVNGLRISTTQRGRFDFKSLDRRDQGGYLEQRHPQLAQAMEPLVMPGLVKQLLQCCMGAQYRMTTFGSLPTQPGAAGGDWHRDIGEGLFGEELDTRLPDYYFNAIIPLDDCGTADNGTEMLLGSHRAGYDGLSGCTRAVASGKVGDIVFFNGKILHRGRPNGILQERNMVYVVYSAKWFAQNYDPNKEYWQSTQPTTGSKVLRPKL
eukprot:TRINITY_DN29256_c0_g1_i1.p1 TRINITY_DN29256_c0_g1~~TRINITY_DN29256_c0_g1_i1.p1  ORF type:complete len:307 (-),score=70.31 TRINITY_DN29256_c0_g1_i1:183-1010(-)